MLLVPYDSVFSKYFAKVRVKVKKVDRSEIDLSTFFTLSIVTFTLIFYLWLYSDIFYSFVQ